VHQIGAYIVLAGVALQFFLAGLGVFQATDYAAHAIVGTLLLLLGLILLVLAAVAKVKTKPTAALFGLLLLQMLLVEIGRGLSAPVISALHPVNAVLVLGAAHFVARACRAGPTAPGLRRRSVRRPAAAWLERDALHVGPGANRSRCGA
jgi:hypothetical membrane protein